MTHPDRTTSSDIIERAQALDIGPIASLFRDLGAKALQLIGTQGGGISSSDRKAIELYFQARNDVGGVVDGVVAPVGTHAANDSAKFEKAA